MAGNEISEEGCEDRFEQWERYGADRLKGDLQNDPFGRVGSQAVQDCAWKFVRMKEAEQAKAQEKAAEAVTLKPGFHGMSVDLKEVWRRVWPYLRRGRAHPRRRRGSAT